MAAFSSGGPWWGGPSWGGPSWGGPSWGGPSGSAASDPVAAAAMLMTRLLLVPGDYTPIQSDIVERAWTDWPTAGPVEAGAAEDRQLAAYAAPVRLSLVVGELASALSVAGGPAQVVLSAGDDVIALIDSPAAVIESEVAQSRSVVKTMSGERLLPVLNTFLAQDHDPLSPYGYVLGMSGGAYPRTAELIGAATEALGSKIFALKHRLAIQRPHVRDAGIVPLLEVPTHLSCPGGHAAKTYLVTTLLKSLVGARPDFARVAEALAALVSDNRVNAGLHFPVDTAAGEVLGRAFANWLLALADTRRTAPWVGAELRHTGGATPFRRVGRPAVERTPDLAAWRHLYAAAAAEWA